MAQGTERTASRAEDVARVIHGFNWGNYGLDDLEGITWDTADYARALADEILLALETPEQAAAIVDANLRRMGSAGLTFDDAS